MNSEFRSAAKPLLILLFLVCFVALSAPAASAQQASDESLLNQTRPRRVDVSQQLQNPHADPVPDQPVANLVIAYTAYREPLSLEPVRLRQVFSLASPSPTAVIPKGTALGNSASSLVPRPAVSTAPMTVGEKFDFWFKGSFLTPGAYIGAIPKGMFLELLDNDDFKKDTFKNFVADSMTRAARSFALSATSGFYEKAVLASIFKQDPRYHRSSKSGAGAKIIYAATRVFVTQGDTCGCDQFNASFLLGGAMGAVTANVWERDERTGPIHTTRRWLNHILFTAGTNILKEFLSGQ